MFSAPCIPGILYLAPADGHQTATHSWTTHLHLPDRTRPELGLPDRTRPELHLPDRTRPEPDRTKLESKARGSKNKDKDWMKVISA